jgi:hypothetical protein
MTLFKISYVSTGGKKWDFDMIEARYIRETSTGYALIDNRDAIVYTVPNGLIVEEVKQ